MPISKNTDLPLWRRFWTKSDNLFEIEMDGLILSIHIGDLYAQELNKKFFDNKGKFKEDVSVQITLIVTLKQQDIVLFSLSDLPHFIIAYSLALASIHPE